MKAGRIILVLWSALVLFSCRPGQQNEQESYHPDADCVQIVMFHLKMRCESCDAVERVTRTLLREEYREEVEEGRVKFVPLNFQSENGRKAAALFQATGQTLYIVKGDSISNLTSPAFMFASTDPDYYRTALRKELDRFLK